MGNINELAYQWGLGEGLFSHLVKISSPTQVRILFFGVKNCARSTVVKGEAIKYQYSRSHLCIKQPLCMLSLVFLTAKSCHSSNEKHQAGL